MLKKENRLKKSILAAFIALTLALSVTSPIPADQTDKDAYEAQKKWMKQERKYLKKQRKQQQDYHKAYEKSQREQFKQWQKSEKEEQKHWEEMEKGKY
jgi:Ni/Co efflux regulator RcnB